MTIEYYAIIDNQASEPYKSIQDLVEDYQIMLQQDIDTFGYYNDISVDSLYQITDEAFDCYNKKRKIDCLEFERKEAEEAINNYCQEVLTIKEETERENELLMAEFSPYALNH
jgi:hypothetical protein